MENYLNYKNSKIHFINFGKGKNLLFVFHGFGEDSSSFEILKHSLGGNYSVIAIDLPLHGKTEWDKKEVFYKNDLMEIIKQFLKIENANEFSLLGYSLGGKMCLAMVEFFPKQIQKIILLAPDGLKENIWYNVAVYPKWGRDLFKYFISNPKWFFRLADFLKILKLLPTSLHKFVYQQMETEEKRQLVFDVWTNIADFSINKKIVKKLLNENDIVLHLFFGKYDKVILPKFGEHFKNGLKNCKMMILEKGHRLIDEELNFALQKYLPLFFGIIFATIE